MNTLSVMLMFAGAVVSSSPPRLLIDTLANGYYWWGGQWVHSPASAKTDDCVCVMGTQKSDGVPGYFCTIGIKGDMNWYDASGFDLSKPLEIATTGGNALWIDRMQFGNKRFGSDNTAGWCLSKDAGDTHFDRWVSVPAGRCSQTLILYPTGSRAGQVYGSGGFGYNYRTAGYKAQQTCRNGRRRSETGEAFVEPMVEPVSVSQDGGDLIKENEVVYLGDLEELKSTGASSKHSRATDALRERMVKLINERNSIQSEEIDEILNEVMLDVEHEEEREAHEGETFEESEDITAEA